MRVTDTVQHGLVDRGGELGGQLLIELDRLTGLRGVLLEFAYLVEDAFELALVVAECVLGFLERDVSTTDERFGVALADAALGVDHVVHRRLRHRGVVALVVTATAVADHVDDDVLVELLTEVHCQLCDPGTGLGIVAVDVEDRRGDHLRHIGAVLGRTRELRRGGEADLVVDDDVHGAAGAVAPQIGQVQRLGDDALACECGVSVQHQRQNGVAALAGALVQQVLLGANEAFENRVDGFEVRRVRGERDLDVVVTEHLDVRALGTEVILHVAGAVRSGRVHVALELGEDLRVGLADDVGEHVQAAAVRHTDDDLVEGVFGALVDDGVHHRDDRLGTFEREPLLPDVLGLQERLERLGGVELAQDVLLLCHSRFDVLGFDAFLQPRDLLGLEDVGVLDADVAAVRVAQNAEHVPQLHLVLAVESADLELAVEVPQREVVADHVEVRVHPEFVLGELQRIRVGHQVTAVAVRSDELEHAGVLVDRALGQILAPANGLVGDLQRVEQLVVELVADQQVVDRLEEIARLRTLNDAVVVRRGQRHELADAELGETLVAGSLELCRVLHRTCADDRSLTVHQTRHRVHGSDSTGVGQRDCDALEVLTGELAVARTTHDVLVRVVELREREVLRVLDGGDDEGTVAVLAGQVDRETEVDRCRSDCVRLAVDLGEVAVHVRERLDGLHDGVAEQVRERDLAAAGASEMVVDHETVVDHELGRDRTDAGRGRNLQRGGHVLRHRCSSAAQNLARLLAELGCGGLCGSGLRRCCLLLGRLGGGRLRGLGLGSGGFRSCLGCCGLRRVGLVGSRSGRLGWWRGRCGRRGLGRAAVRGCAVTGSTVGSGGLVGRCIGVVTGQKLVPARVDG